MACFLSEDYGIWGDRSWAAFYKQIIGFWKRSRKGSLREVKISGFRVAGLDLKRCIIGRSVFEERGVRP